MKIFSEIDSLEMAQVLRVIRNECVHNMTNSTEQVSEKQQVEFYKAKFLTGIMEGSILYDDYAPVGYAYLVWIDGQVWSSTGVMANMRGMGYGRDVFNENIRRAHRMGLPLWAECRCDNGPQQHIHKTSPGYALVQAEVEKNGAFIDIQKWELP